MDNWDGWKDVLRNADVDTARLIVQLQMEDAAALTKTPRNHPPRSDADLARKLFEDELKQIEGELPNRQLGEELEDDDNDLQEALEAAAFSWKLKQWEGVVEHVPEPVKPVSCTACSDDLPADELLKAPCGHYYCPDCLENLYTSCLTDETLFPPRCCQQEFPWNLAKPYLTQRCKSLFGGKRAELETKDRTYCHVPTCSVFIKPDTISGDLASCPKCHVGTCVRCKGQAHYDACPRDEALDVLMGTASLNQWQRCFGCRRVIELKTGCNHITGRHAIALSGMKIASSSAPSQ
ncbi:hypothetical protein LTR37_008080 [Vermiconidia calcicola]|uniref:Uncharacterized protein n=1 Tax=Vermiconidia calcicola TaxID=1690605 RepID=A0ACC3NBY3_9PEZI|nr:hypothetical protein LTR37_008080 [Vermiconidia calcicola]